MAETLIVPGLFGSPKGHWQHHWASDDPTAELVEQEDFGHPQLADWIHTLEARIAASPPGVVLVGHSLGCALIAALADRPTAAHVGGALLVAPAEVKPLADTHPAVIEFAAAQRVELPFASILVASRNDPFMDIRAAERQARRWGSAFLDLGQVGHINIASGFGPWDEGRTIADGLRGRLGRHVPPASSVRPPRRDSYALFGAAAGFGGRAFGRQTVR
ncbi:alpha/beta hydrolase [Aureimonas leprariae]|uniref:Alpha/beta hydrolase n=1 Tax=Plantimonas leprariae TaxID=2615207 RepID=A0A7V7TYM2_9HYPH|nr:alpha/beta hydrolase [Aureimonas leprariae]KAB0677520.1 alpha/beta hydrolase [Aureimonas leprariae]